LPYDHKLKQGARELRKAGMLHEVLLWQRLKEGQLHGLNFDRQTATGSYLVDSNCAERATVVEIDRCSHDGRQDYDGMRQLYLENLGLTVIRFGAVNVLQDLNWAGCLENHPALAGTPPGEGKGPSKHPVDGSWSGICKEEGTV